MLNKGHVAEIKEGLSLIDGFVFRESYVYMNDKGVVLNSQSILDDIESLPGQGPVTRYDVMGTKGEKQDRAYLATLAERTRDLLTDARPRHDRVLPARPVQISESDTSRFADIDFILHYTDLVGTYAEQGLDTVSTWMLANSIDQAKCYIDKLGNKRLSSPARYRRQVDEHLIVKLQASGERRSGVVGSRTRAGQTLNHLRTGVTSSGCCRQPKQAARTWGASTWTCS